MENSSILISNDSTTTWEWIISNVSNVTKSTKPTDNFPYTQNAIFGSIFALIGITGVIGNSLVIVAVACDGKMRKSAMNVLLLNLAIADLSNLMVCVPDILLNLLQLGWLLPTPLCPLLRYLEVCFLYTSLLTQVAVCIERFFAIALPMRIHLLFSRKKVVVWACALWALAAVCSVPVAIWNKVLNDRKTNHIPLCIWKGNQRLIVIFRCFECLTFYFVPLVLIVVLYTKISLILWSKNEALHEGSTQSATEKLKSNEPLRIRKNVVKMLIACVCVYFICYSPIQVIFIAETFFDRYFKLNSNIRYTFNCLTYACSAGNPLLYSIFSQKFRRKFTQILCCRKGGDNDYESKAYRYQRSAGKNSNSYCVAKFYDNENVALTYFDEKNEGDRSVNSSVQ